MLTCSYTIATVRVTRSDNTVIYSTISSDNSDIYYQLSGVIRRVKLIRVARDPDSHYGKFAAPTKRTEIVKISSAR